MKKSASLQIKTRPAALDRMSAHANFYPHAKALRAHFEHTFQDPLQAKTERFCWDYWSVKDQYRLLRTPAEYFFPEDQYQKFLNHLLSWGRETIGCQMISKPWLSAYIDGSFQNLHSDVPHGPYSFVYSLTPWQTRKFTGGETLMAEPKLLRYFSELEAGTSHEEKDFLTRIPPKFNQLTLFDPRYPHGVAQVNGVENLLEARLVIHGWFTEPRPMVEGSLTPKKANTTLDQIAMHLLGAFEALPYSGLFTIRMHVSTSGSIASVTLLAGHLVDQLGHVISKKELHALLGTLSEFQFPKAAQASRVTLPLLIGI